jgi:hypothetical protein
MENSLSNKDMTLRQEIIYVPDGHGNELPICKDCFDGKHEHLEWMKTVHGSFDIEKHSSLFSYLSRLNDCKNVNLENTVQCCCRVGVP